MKTLNRILASTLAVAAMGGARLAAPGECNHGGPPLPDDCGKSCQVTVGPPPPPPVTPPPNLTSFRVLFGGACPPHVAVQWTDASYSTTWYGVTSSVHCISSNGYIRNGACGGTCTPAGSGIELCDSLDFANTCTLPDTVLPDNAVYGIWDNWDCGAYPTGNIFIDAGPTGVKARWVNVGHVEDSMVAANFDVALYFQDIGEVNVGTIVDPNNRITGTIGTEDSGGNCGRYLDADGICFWPSFAPMATSLPPTISVRFAGSAPPPRSRHARGGRSD